MWSIVALIVVLLLLVVGVYDLLQRDHAILRNFPLIGHLRYLGITPRYLWNNLRKIRTLQSDD